MASSSSVAFSASFDNISPSVVARQMSSTPGITPQSLTPDAKRQRQACGHALGQAVLHYVVKEWLDGDPGNPPPPPERQSGRNHEWMHVNNADVISMPDKWEYPWYAAWDLAFHCIPLAWWTRISPRNN